MMSLNRIPDPTLDRGQLQDFHNKQRSELKPHSKSSHRGGSGEWRDVLDI
jgi:hypothetical protein